MPNTDRISKSVLFKADRIITYMSEDDILTYNAESFYYLGAIADESFTSNTLALNVPVAILATQLPRHHLVDIAKLHGVSMKENMLVADMRELLRSHVCNDCSSIRSIFMPYKQNTSTERMRFLRSKKKITDQTNISISNVKDRTVRPSVFPPLPPSRQLIEQICNGFIADTAPHMLEEEGCAVCACLNPTKSMTSIDEVHDMLYVLNEYVTDEPITRKERQCDEDPVTEINGLPLASGCSKVCATCLSYLKKENIPPRALANGLWIGDVPLELQDLSFAEKLLIARVRHNGCLVRVSSGMHKLRANAIMFQTPIPKIYDVLPPHSSELDEALAIIYTGPSVPTSEDFKRTPFLVRRNKVADALNWLKLNHIDYCDVIISQDNIMSYPEDMPPVTIGFREKVRETNQEPESTGLDNLEHEDGTSSGACSFSVHGLIGNNLRTLDLKSLTAIALDHLKSGGKVLAVGHAEQPESMYNNPQLYPQIFPWLFPYGLGGLSNGRGHRKISERLHKKHLLMYYDKRFQMDAYFPILAMNQEQMKASTTGGYILTNRKTFPTIANRLMSIDSHVLQDLARRMGQGEKVTPNSDKEKDCFRLIHDIDHVAHRVEGSITTKKYMRNEMWSLMAYKGAPSWFITFSPADNKHPICLYYADKSVVFKPSILDDNERYRLIANNPVAGARFFDVMVRMFIKHVLGVGTEHTGLYGDTSAYYGTVEQQGRLTLHLHLLLWLECSLTPQEIRDRILDPSSEFQTRLIQYLESVHTGGFINSDIAGVQEKIERDMLEPTYTDPTTTLPIPAPTSCVDDCSECAQCNSNASWWSAFCSTFNDLLYRSNRHRCGVRCLANKHNSCKARFPRDTHENTTVDPVTGAVTLKKIEAWINTVSPCLTYLFRCNTDVTSLLSGTAIKSVIAYTTEYITKPALKTHAIFDIIRMLIDKKYEMLSSDISQTEKARKLMTSIVNSMTSKMEMGGPMAAMYLLGLPDHYTNHKFKCFYWSSYVNEVTKSWNQLEQTAFIDEECDDEKLLLMKSNEDYVGTSSVMDYMHRPEELSSMSLYDWIRLTDRVKGKRQRKASNTQIDVESGLQLDDDETLNACEDEDVQLTDNVSDGPTRLKKPTSYRFMNTHPLYKSHMIELYDETNAKIPNFVGASLPRRDQGDREYYCRTMLTLFKPWRNGLELKQNGTSWSETFEEHIFTDRQRDVMKYFNIRYECLDAKDDYSKRRNGKGEDIHAKYMFADDINDLDQIAHNEYIVNNLKHDDESDFDDTYFAHMGTSGIDYLNAGIQIANILKNAGWMDNLIGKIKRSNYTYLFDPNTHSAMEWKQILTSAKNAISKAREATHRAFKSTKCNLSSHTAYIDQVDIVDSAYLKKTYKCKDVDTQKLIDDTVLSFTLNKEQERAFRIIANHTANGDTDQLKMYLGGMAGTGKSQVIKALVSMFRSRGEEHRFITLAPTGSAAALIDGSTYHAALGIDSHSDKSESISTMSEVKTRLDGVDYIFIDEISMISCRDMYRISKQLANAMNEPVKPFGGKNVIFAGDFAQLQPVQQKSLYSHSVGTFTHSGMTNGGQEEAIGKSLWHQITTVVILRENMRQKTQSIRDAQFRTALENMRYKMCTTEDIQFLRTLVAGRGKHQPKLAHKNFRYVSVITAQNVHKDHINELGLQRFAEEHNERLTTFYSLDKWSDVDKVDNKGNTKRQSASATVINPPRNTNIVKGKARDVLWDLPPSKTDHFAGKLQLCKGMPVIIKRNEATECCITNGAEATVYDWISHVSREGHESLDMLFVQLKDPPRDINLEDLPINVVPIQKRSKTVKCTLHNDQIAFIERSQVMVLPNFAMTDYASQGRTRPHNVVDLNNCRNHQSYYTCLSRSSSANGTVIVQGFDSSKVVGGASGDLRKEFRELELLDDLTRLRFEDELDPSVQGHRRHDLIRSFQSKMGVNYMPAKAHKCIQWTKENPFIVDNDTQYEDWRIVQREKKDKTSSSKKVKADIKLHPSSVNISVVKAQKHALPYETETCAALSSKKQKIHVESENEHNASVYTGNEWDETDYSCAYDSLFNSLYMIWSENVPGWTARFNNINSMTQSLVSGYHRTKASNCSIQLTRNSIRERLHAIDPLRFPWGQRGTSVCELIDVLLSSRDPLMDYYVYCDICQSTSRRKTMHTPIIYNSNAHRTYRSTADRFKQMYAKKLRGAQCCNHNVNIHIDEVSPLMMFQTQSIDMKISKEISITDDTFTEHKWRLSSVIYLSNWHFTCISIDKTDNMWYSDSRDTPNKAVYVKRMSDTDYDRLRNYDGRASEVAVYTYVS